MLIRRILARHGPCLTLAFALSACNGPTVPDQPLARNEAPANPAVIPGGDGSFMPSPTPTPTATATPRPTPTVTPTPTPTTSPAQLYNGAAELNKYVMAFVDNAKAEGFDAAASMRSPKLAIRVASLSSVGSSTIGLCSWSSTSRTVTFDTRFWNAASETSREILTHHELGHCVLNRYHKSTRLTSGAYASIMTPYILSASAYLGNRLHYLEELFANRALGNLAAAAVNSTEGDASGEIIHVCDGSDLDL